MLRPYRLPGTLPSARAGKGQKRPRDASCSGFVFGCPTRVESATWGRAQEFLRQLRLSSSLVGFSGQSVLDGHLFLLGGVESFGCGPLVLLDNLFVLCGCLLACWLSVGVLADGGVALLPHALDTIRGDLCGFVSGEELIVLILVILEEFLLVGGNVNSEDSLSVLLGVQISLLESGESLVTMWDIHTTISCALEAAEDSGTSGCTCQTQIEDSLEGACTITGFNFKVFTVGLSAAFVLCVQFVLLQQTTCAQKASGVAGGVVGKSHRG